MEFILFFVLFSEDEERKMKVFFYFNFSDSIFVSLLIPCYFTGFTSWSMKAVKELYGKKTGKKMGGQDIFYIFYFISGFNNHSVGEEIIPEYK